LIRFKKNIYSFIATLLVLSLLVFATGNSHLFKAISSTYLVGKKKPTINDFSLFENRPVKTGKYKPWKISKNYNRSKNKELILNIEKHDPVALLIVKGNEIIYENYWYEYYENSLTNSFSVAKTFIGLLIGIAIDEEKIKSVDDPVYLYLPQYKNNPDLTIKHLLTMSSGINFDENYTSPFGHMAKAYYGTDIKKLNDSYSVTKTPGERWKYLGGNTIILSLIIEKVVGSTASEYMSKKVWKPIGAKNTALWSLDKKNGREKAYCCFYSNARDFARIGQLYLNKGQWGNYQIVSEKYINESTSPAFNLRDEHHKIVDFYGYQMWLNYYKNLDIFYARGLQGQYIITIPEKELVIVRLGFERGAKQSNHHFEDLYTYINFALAQ